jgi:hypothetical protein
MPTDQTATVTAIHPLIHYAPCERETYGRAVMALLDLDCEITAARVRGWVARFRETASCDCLKMRTLTVVGQLERADKAFKASMTEDNADRVAFLKAELARLRGMA